MDQGFVGPGYKSDQPRRERRDRQTDGWQIFDQDSGGFAQVNAECVAIEAT
jgi:hypothetical protein